MNEFLKKHSLESIDPATLSPELKAEFDTFMEAEIDFQLPPIYTTELGNATISGAILSILDNSILIDNEK